jgi:hypothetical protein
VIPVDTEAIIQAALSAYRAPNVGGRRAFFPRMRMLEGPDQARVWDALQAEGVLRPEHTDRSVPSPYIRSDGSMRKQHPQHRKFAPRQAKPKPPTKVDEIDRLKAQVEQLELDLLREQIERSEANVSDVDPAAVLAQLSPADLLARVPLRDAAAHVASHLVDLWATGVDWLALIAEALTPVPQPPAQSQPEPPSCEWNGRQQEAPSLRVAIYTTREKLHFFNDLKARFQGTAKLRYYTGERYIDINPDGSDYCIAMVSWCSHMSTTTLKAKWPKDRLFEVHGGIEKAETLISDLLRKLEGY